METNENWFDHYNLDGSEHEPGKRVKSLLEQEQELLAQGFTEEDLNRLYPNVIGNGHPDVCLCPTCAPSEYQDHEPDDNFGYTDAELDALANSERNFYRPGNATIEALNAKTIFSGYETPEDDHPF